MDGSLATETSHLFGDEAGDILIVEGWLQLGVNAKLVILISIMLATCWHGAEC